ncbi:MAG: peptidyl-tRNA hydrolase Pth2 [Candidatus Nanohaloarchaea archaeon]
MSSYKQALILREDLDISKGKMISQACHASLKAYKQASEKQKEEWEKTGSKKIVLDIGSQKLEEKQREADKQGLPNAIIKDAGLTEIEPGTKTALGIGPAKDSKINKITGQLALIK